jgi:hypothetical protein
MPKTRPPYSPEFRLIPAALSFDRCPIPGGYRSDPGGIANESVPSITARLDDGVIAIPNPHAELIAAKIFPDILDGIEFGCVWRQPKQAEVGWHSQALARLVPPGTVTDQHGMGLGADLVANLGQVYGHRFAADPGHDDGGAHGTARADRTEDVGRGMAVVANRRRTGAPQGPQIGQRALLADARLILEPDLDPLAGGLRRQDLCYTSGKVFLKARLTPRRPSWGGMAAAAAVSARSAAAACPRCAHAPRPRSAP